MNIRIPHYKQEDDNTCALACLRMVLAAYGTHVQESEIKALAHMELNGTRIDELERLAHHFHLEAEIQDVTLEEMQQLLTDGKLPIAYIDRKIFELTPRHRTQHSIRNATIHNVIPIEVTAKSVIYHDPLQPRITRKTARLFGQAFRRLGGRCVVCWKPE